MEDFILAVISFSAGAGVVYGRRFYWRLKAMFREPVEEDRRAGLKRYQEWKNG